MSAQGEPRRLALVEDERSFFLRSLRDLEREHAAGDVDDDDYERLRARYTEAAARALREQGAAPPERERGLRRLRRALGRRRTRRVLAIGGTASLLAGIALAAASFAGARLPGEDPTGSVSVPQATKVAQQLVEASEFANAGQISSALNMYAVVLSEVPRQPEALTYEGWLERLAGLSAHSASTVREGDGQMRTAIREHPSYPDARALFGIALDEDDHDASGAIAQFRAFLADHPSSTLVAEVGPQLAAIYTAAHVAVPTRLRAYVGSPQKTVR